MAASRVLCFFLLCFFFLCGISEVQSQTCEPLVATTCSPIIPPGTPVFVPADRTLEDMEHFTSSLINIINYNAYPDPCRSYSFQLICGTWLRPCLQVGNVTLPIPQEPCLDICNVYYDACHNSFPFTGFLPVGLGLYFPSGKAPLNCSVPIVDIWAGNITFYQDGVSTIEYQARNYSVPCTQQTPVSVPAPTFCEYPLTLSTSAAGGPQCAFTCPLPSLSDSQYDSVKIMQGIMGWMSWVTSAALILMLVFNPRTRSFPRNLILMVSCAANIAAGAIILPTFAGYENIWCGGGATVVPEGTIVGVDSHALPVYSWNTDETALSLESSACTFQGAMLQFGFLAAVFWWVLIAFNMTLELYLSKVLPLDEKKWKWLRFIIYLFIGWGLAFLLMVIPASAGQIKFAPAGTYCFVTNEDDYAWSLVFWFIPVGISLLLGVTFFILAIIRLVWILIKLKKLQKLIILNIRLLLFVFLYLALIVFITAYNITYANNKDKIDQGYSDYYSCLIFGQAGCSLPDDVSNYNLVMLKSWAISSLGTMLFLLFISWDVIKFWYDLFLGIILAAWKKNPQYLFKVFSMLANESSRTSMTIDSGGDLSLTVLDEGDDEHKKKKKKDSKKKDGNSVATTTTATSTTLDEEESSSSSED